MRTPWGYSVAELPPVMGAGEFREATGGVFSSTDERVAAVLDQVSQAVRDWCGWHVAPVLECEWDGEGEGRLIRLPVMGLEAVTLTVNGSEVDPDTYQWTESGLVRRSCGRFPSEWRSVHASFTAGFPTTGAIAAAVVQLASNALAGAPGVREEHAGQVGITYNQTASGVSGGVRLLESDMALLAPYRITEV